ncbi:MAG TPA: sulfatase-like hydrolase/transferase, partial [Planctomycetota bacterium]|nr:sulfatase-like hydrolase/transferase [Planctomycetota bacterium]
MRSISQYHPASSKAARSLPQVLLVVMDTTRADSLSCYGYGRTTSPALDRFAEYSTVYTRAYAPSSWTIPSHGSLFTGLPASLHGMYLGRHAPLEGVGLFTDRLAELGYDCTALSSNYMITLLVEALRSKHYPAYEDRPYLPSDRFALRCLRSEQSV